MRNERMQPRQADKMLSQLEWTYHLRNTSADKDAERLGTGLGKTIGQLKKGTTQNHHRKSDNSGEKSPARDSK